MTRSKEIIDLAFRQSQALFGREDGESSDEIRRKQSNKNPDKYAMGVIKQANEISRSLGFDESCWR